MTTTMIELPARLVSPLQALADQQQSSIETIVEDLVTEYLRKQRHQRLLDEIARYQARHAQLVAKYRGQFVGLQEGRVLDSDLDGGKLYARLCQQYGDTPILIVEVNDRPEQEFRRLSRQVVPCLALS